MPSETEVRAKIRLLHCHECGTIEELPDFDGPPEYDSVLEYVAGRHETNGYRHVGKLYDVEERVWELKNLRNALIEQIRGRLSSGLAAFDSSFYDTRDTLRADALSCYSAHLRPKEGCSDWRTQRKMLLPPTRQDRKEVGLSMEGAPKRWLCDFCPVRAHYERKNNEALGVI